MSFPTKPNHCPGFRDSEGRGEDAQTIRAHGSVWWHFLAYIQILLIDLRNSVSKRIQRRHKGVRYPDQSRLQYSNHLESVQCRINKLWSNDSQILVTGVYATSLLPYPHILIFSFKFTLKQLIKKVLVSLWAIVSVKSHFDMQLCFF